MKYLLYVLLLSLVLSCSTDPDEALLNAKANLNKGAFETARYHLENLIEDDSTNFEAFLLMGKLENELKNYHEAVKYLSKSVTLNPEFIPAYKERAKIYRKIGDLNNSLKDLQVLIDLYPKDGSIYFERANVYFDMDKMDEACQDWLKASELGEGEAKRIYEKFCVQMEFE
jgi:tetratricopeptide (TPR) repeat protein